ncbi:hypothetical protein NX059_005986 [Plenodomus lindquistii]|nr:hypothetical protein NX059_005986 [Plenodomus lindquistii]
MYQLADKYNAVGLKDLVIEKFDRGCRLFWDDEQFAIAADHVFSSTPEEDDGLRDMVIATISKHREILNKAEVNALIAKYHSLALGVVNALAGVNRSGDTGNKRKRSDAN